jgi:hypothetical protein
VSNVARVREIVAAIDGMRVDALIQFFADDAVMELPFAPGRMPRRYEGRAASYGFQTFVRDAFRSFSMTADAIYETSDPNVVIAELHSDGVVAENGRPYRNRYVIIITFDDDGRITNWREYYDPAEVIRAFRRRDQEGSAR